MSTDPQMFIRIAATVEDLKTAMAQARQAVVEAGEGAKEAGLHFQSFGDQFTQMGERIVERLAIYELLRVSFDTLKESLNLGAEIEHMARSIGIGTDELQKLTYAGQQYGISADLMVRGTETLSAKLANGDKNLASAFEKLGLSTEEFRAMSPNEAMVSLADAVGKVGDPMEKAGEMAHIFGMRLSRELIPAMDDLRAAEAAMPASALISEGDVKAAHDFEIALANLKTEVEAGTLSFIMYAAELLHLKNAHDDLVAIETKHQGVLNEITNIENDAAQGAGILSVTAQALTAHLQGLTKDALIPLSDATQKYVADARTMGGSAEEIAAAIHAPLAAVQAYIKTLDDGDKAFETWAAAWNTVRAAALPLVDTLHTMTAVTVAGAEAALTNGVAHKTVAEAYHLSDVQLQALVTDVKDHAAALKLDAASVLEVSKLWDEFNVIASKGGSAFDDQVASIDKWALDLEAKAQKAGTDTAAFYDALTALWNAKLHQASQNVEHSIEDVGETARSVFFDINDAIMGITSDFDGWNDAIMNVKRSLDGTIQSERDLQKAHDAGNTLDLATAAQDPAIMEFLHQGYSLKNAEALKLGRLYGFTPSLFDNLGNPETTPSPGERVPGYIGGVENAPGGWAMVGEAGPELMRVPRGADIYPTGTGPGGTTQTINLVVDGRVLASVVADHTMQRQRNIGVRF
jgi:hypothetical protein